VSEDGVAVTGGGAVKVIVTGTLTVLPPLTGVMARLPLYVPAASGFPPGEEVTLTVSGLNGVLTVDEPALVDSHAPPLVVLAVTVKETLEPPDALTTDSAPAGRAPEPVCAVKAMAGAGVPQLLTQVTVTLPPPVELLTVKVTATVWTLPLELKVSVPL